MLSISDIKQGVVIKEAGDPYLVIKTQHVQMGRGGAILRTRLKNLITGNILEKTFKGADKSEEADLEDRKASFLYKDENDAHFMDGESFEQFSLSLENLGDQHQFLKEGIEVKVLQFEGNPVSVQLPTKITFKVDSTPPGVKGDTAQGKVTKPATLETGVEINVPLFVKEGDSVVVNVEKGEYVERA